jgi:hypothetical protein
MRCRAAVPEDAFAMSRALLNYVAQLSRTMPEYLDDGMRESGIRDAQLSSTATAHRSCLSAGWTDIRDRGSDCETLGLTRVYPI